MSGEANCRDNATAENYFGYLKAEASLYCMPSTV